MEDKFDKIADNVHYWYYVTLGLIPLIKGVIRLVGYIIKKIKFAVYKHKNERK